MCLNFGSTTTYQQVVLGYKNDKKSRDCVCGIGQYNVLSRKNYAGFSHRHVGTDISF